MVVITRALISYVDESFVLDAYDKNDVILCRKKTFCPLQNAAKNSQKVNLKLSIGTRINSTKINNSFSRTFELVKDRRKIKIGNTEYAETDISRSPTITLLLTQKS